MSSVLVHDNGLFPFIATKLAESFDRVLYFVPYVDAFPLSRKLLWGEGLPNVERVKDFWDVVDDVDVLVFPDIGSGDLQLYLRAHDYTVWGSGGAEILEIDRGGLKRLMLSKGMPRPKTWIITGMDDLWDHINNPVNDDQYVKASEFRGDLETVHHRSPWMSQPWMRKLDHQLGPMRERMQFVVEKSVEGIEVGYDGYCIDGAFPGVALFGYEHKDLAYIGRVCKASELPIVLQEVNLELGPVLMELGCRSLFSTEVRVTKDGTGFLIDPALRFPSPPSEAMTELFANWKEIITNGADGEIVDPSPVAMYCAQLILRSPHAEDDFLAIRFPPDLRRFVKLHNHAIVDGVDYVINTGMDIIGSAVGLGDTMEEAIGQAKEVAAAVEGYEVQYEEAGFDVLKERIEKGITYGVNW